MTDLTLSPQLDTWYNNQLVTADKLNANVRDPQLFLSQAPLTVVMRTAAQSIPSGSNTAVIFDTEIIDVDKMIEVPSTNLWVMRPGMYLIQFQGHLSPNGSGRRAAFIYVNDVTVAQITTNPAATDTCLDISIVVACNAGDKVNAWVYQNSGTSLSCGGNATEAAPRLAIRLLSSALIDVDYSSGDPVEQPPEPPPSTPPASTPTKYAKAFHATWSRSYAGDNTTRWNDPAVCYQGYGDSYNGNQKSLVGFDYSAIQSALSGATNITAQFGFKVLHTWYSSGATIRIDAARYLSKPSTWSASYATTLMTTKGVAGNWYVVTLPSGTGDKFKSGAFTAMGFGPGYTTSYNYYTYIAGNDCTSEPVLKFIYWK